MEAPDPAAERPAPATPATWGTMRRSGLPVALAEIQDLPLERFRQTCVGACAAGGRLAALVALPAASRDAAAPQQLLAVLADDQAGRLGFLRTPVPAHRSYTALTPELPQAHAFEREMYEAQGIRPAGHPWLRPLRQLASPTGAAGAAFFEMEGAGLHEVAVGPVHAGIIEPGHFRFQCSGETILHLEIRLGYQHRGAQELLLRSAPGRRLSIAESIAGDTAIGHATAYCQALEALASVEAPLGAQVIRAIALELERLANHVGDLGALCNDIGYQPGAAWFGRLRGEFLNVLLDITGNRFGRGLIHPGGVRFGITAEQRQELLGRLAAAERDLLRVAELVFGTESVNARFENTGVVARHTAAALGLVGPAARASGCDRDARRDHPTGLYRFAHIPVASADTGDVMARAHIRWIETQRSLTFVQEQLREYRATELVAQLPACRAVAIAVSIVEGWRGEIVHLAVTSETGELTDYQIIDPSLRNWFGLAVAVRGNQISDFPLCNKSFNLSYAGHDL
jgi:Ni,Fe-hydrogenase III large subunit